MLDRLRHLLVAWYAGLLLACVLGFGAAGIGLLNVALRSDLDGVLGASARMVQAAWQEDGSTAGAQAAPNPGVSDEIKEIARGQGLSALRLKLPGEPAIALGPKMPHHAAGFFDLTLGKRPYRVLSTRIGPGGAKLELAISSRRARRLLGHSWLALGLMSPVVLLVAVGGGAWLAGRAIAPAQDAFDRLKQFTQDVSHELRTPLATLAAEVDVALAKRDPDAADLKERLVRIGRTTDRMSRLVGDLLVWVRQDAGTLRVRPESTDVTSLLDSVAGDMTLLHPDVNFVVEVPPGLRVMGDPFYLGQALDNLADNAAYHSVRGQPVTLRAESAAARIRLSVVDRGPGIPPDKLERLFVRFERGGDRPGAGLGLAISQAIAHAHGTAIAVESRPGSGTRFWFELPAARVLHQVPGNQDETV